MNDLFESIDLDTARLEACIAGLEAALGADSECKVSTFCSKSSYAFQASYDFVGEASYEKYWRGEDTTSLRQLFVELADPESGHDGVSRQWEAYKDFSLIKSTDENESVQYLLSAKLPNSTQKLLAIFKSSDIENIKLACTTLFDLLGIDLSQLIIKKDYSNAF